MATAKTRREREVWEACDAAWEELQLTGESIDKITGDRIRAKLISLGYARGNQNQIYAYRQSWKRAMGFDDDEMETEQVEQLEARVTQVVNYVMSAVNEHANAQIEETRTEYINRTKYFQDANTQLKHDLGKATEKHNDLLINHEKLSKQLASTLDDNAKFQADIKAMTEKLDQLQAKFNEAKKGYENEKIKQERLATEQITKLEKKIQDIEHEYKAEVNALREANENDRQRWMLEQDHLKQQVASLKEKQTHLQSQLAISQQNNASLEAELEHQKNQHEQKNVEAKELIRDLNSQLDVAGKENTKLNTLLISKDEQVIYLKEQIAEQNKLLASLNLVKVADKEGAE